MLPVRQRIEHHPMAEAAAQVLVHQHPGVQTATEIPHQYR